MSKYITFEDRLEIENCLTKKKSFGKIGKVLDKDRTTIAREIKKYSSDEKYSSFTTVYNPCVHRKDCKKINVCGDLCKRKSSKYCRNCGICCDKCDEFEEEICLSRFKPPYVCNGCDDKYTCTLEKTVYTAKHAQQLADSRISESRTGYVLSENDVTRLNALLTPLIKNGQSLHQIYENNVDKIMCSERALYNYIDAGILEVRNIDLPRKVRYRPRKKKKEFKVDRNCYMSRTFTDYQKYLVKHPEYVTVQMDSVIGTIGGKVLLTIHFTNCNLMLAYLRDANTAQSVTDIYEQLFQTLGIDTFRNLFQVILTDRGSEFTNPLAIELGPDMDEFRTKVFFCDPNSPFQKGSIEVNHEFIRRIIPKGKTFDNLTQEQVNLMMSHINSYSRKSLGNKSPYDLFCFIYGQEIADKLGLNKIPANEILLHPRLLKDPYSEDKYTGIITLK